MIKINLIYVQTTFENSKTYRTSARTKWPPICCSKKEVVEGWCWWGEWRCWPTWRRSSCECSSKDKCPRNDFPETNFVFLFLFSLNDIFNSFFIKFALKSIHNRLICFLITNKSLSLWVYQKIITVIPMAVEVSSGTMKSGLWRMSGITISSSGTAGAKLFPVQRYE